MTPITAVATTTEMDVLTAADMVEQCKISIAVATTVTMTIMLPVNIIGMVAMFTKAEKMFNPNRIAAKTRQKKFSNRVRPQKR